MTEHDDLHDAFGALLGHSALPPVDRREQVQVRIGRIRRRRQAVSAAGAAVVLAGAGLVFANVRNHAPAHVSVAALRAAPAARLTLEVVGGGTHTVGKGITFKVLLTGLSENPDDYGLLYKFGDNHQFRAYGASHCVLTSPVNAHIDRSVGSTYDTPGTYQMTVVATLCGVVKAQATTTVVVTR